MNTKKILTTIKKIPVIDLRREEVYLAMKLATILAATHLANKLDKVVRDASENNNSGRIFDIFK